MNIRARMLQRLHVYASDVHVHTRVNDDDLQIEIPAIDCLSEAESPLLDFQFHDNAPRANSDGEIDSRLKAEILELEGKIDLLLKKHRENEILASRPAKK